jgi:1L-myo-inositol 1-phosphate cytidylyltransferase
MTRISEAIVLMAGTGSRLARSGARGLKPLTPILQRPLVSYIFEALTAAGIRVIHAVVGYESESVTDQVTSIMPSGLEVRFVENADWQKQNGLSVLAAANRVKSPFILAMSDHLFDNELLTVLLMQAQTGTLNLAIDRKIESIVDIDDAMKVRTKGDRVIAIGKKLAHYDAIDTGLFVANEELFEYLEEAKRDGDCSLADGVRLMSADGKVRAIDIGDCWWQDVDTPETLIAAENHLRSRLNGPVLSGAGTRTQR